MGHCAAGFSKRFNSYNGSFLLFSYAVQTGPASPAISPPRFGIAAPPM